MKRKDYFKILNVLSLATILMSILFFQGCRTNHQGGNNKSDIVQGAGEIVEAKLTDNEEQLIKAVGVDRFLVLDASIKDSNIKWIDFWVDYYEKGQLKNKLSGIGTEIESSKNQNMRIIVSTQWFKTDTREEKWCFSMTSYNGTSTGSTIVQKPKEASASAWSGIKSGKIIMGEEMILGVIAEGKDSTAIPGYFFESKDKDTAMKELLKNDYVYIIKCKFK